MRKDKSISSFLPQTNYSSSLVHPYQEICS